MKSAESIGAQLSGIVLHSRAVNATPQFSFVGWRIRPQIFLSNGYISFRYIHTSPTSNPSSATASHPNIGSNALVEVPAKSISKSSGNTQSLSPGSTLFKISRQRLAAPYPANQIASNDFVLSTSAFHSEQSVDCESVRIQMTGIRVAWNKK